MKGSRRAGRPDPVPECSTIEFENVGWGNWVDHDALKTTAARLNAFPWKEGSADSGMLATFQPGSFTVHVSSVSGATGIVILELYDAD